MAKSAKRSNYKVSVIGAKELEQLLEGMGDDAARHIEAAVRRGGQIALAAAKQSVPVDTGKLRDSIKLESIQRKAAKAGSKKRIVSGSVKLGFNSKGKNGAYYGSFVELGTKYQKATFFLRDAVDRNKVKIAAAMTAYMSNLRR